MSVPGPSRHFAAARNSVAFGPKRTLSAPPLSYDKPNGGQR
jgi:hypothetical protein